ncbi:hypothetical protein D3C75_1168000 [compost metagenome]
MVRAARVTRTVSAFSKRVEFSSSLTRNTRPLNRLAIVANSIRTIAALSMAILRGDAVMWISIAIGPTRLR